MPLKLNKDDQAWILREITDAINPQGWRKALSVLREIAPLGGIFAIVLALIAIVVTLGIAVVNRRDVEATFRGGTEQQLKGIERQLIDLRALVASSQPARKQNQDAAKELLAEVRQKLIPPIPAAVVENAGKSFVDAAQFDESAWAVALDFVAYRTVLNTNLAAVGTAHQIATTPVDPNLTTNYRYRIAGQQPVVSVGGDVPLDQSAIIDYMGREPPLNVGQTRGKQVILIEGGSIVLDDALMKHVVIRNSSVIYSGDPLQLEDVIFVNCTFVLKNKINTRNFSLAVLSRSSTSFQA